MDIRNATQDDTDPLREIARRSLTESYPVELEIISAGIDEWYAPEEFERKLTDPNHHILVAEHDPPSGPEPIGFVEMTISDTNVADIRWLHVDPRFRDLGIGSTLFEHAREKARNLGATQVRGRVLADNTDGNAFYSAHGLSKSGEATLEIAGESFTEHVYVELKENLRLLTTESGTELFVDPDLAESGSTGSFYTVFSDPERNTKWGYYCSNCDSLVTTMDTMERIACTTCGNTRKPTRWDAAYL